MKSVFQTKEQVQQNSDLRFEETIFLERATGVWCYSRFTWRHNILHTN